LTGWPEVDPRGGHMCGERLWEGPKPASDKGLSREEWRAWVSAWNLVNYLNGSVPFGKKM